MPSMSSLKTTPNRSADRLKILHSLFGILCASFAKQNDRIRSGMQIYDIVRSTNRDQFFREIASFQRFDVLPLTGIEVLCVIHWEV